MNLRWIYAFNVLINSVLVFLTVALLVKFLLWVCKIKQPRVQALCLSLPLFKVGFDLFLYDFSRWALTYQINPMLCEPGTRAISLMFSYPTSIALYFPLNTSLHFTIADGKTFTVADLIVLSINPLWIKLIVMLAFSISIVFCSVRFRQVLKARKMVKKILQNSLPCLRTLSAPIEAILKKNKIHVLFSAEVDVPCAVSRSIIFPKKLLSKLSQVEFEVIVVHELDHLQWKDSALRATQKILGTFFWWIPTKRWRSHLEFTQELACDAKISKFHLAPIDLASAIIKSARAATLTNSCLPIMYFIEKGRLLDRMKALIKPLKRRPWGFRMIQCLLIFSFLTVIFFGHFWIF